MSENLELDWKNLLENTLPEYGTPEADKSQKSYTLKIMVRM